MSENSSEQLARRAAFFGLTKKAENVLLIDLKPVTSMADYFVICHGRTDVQVKAIADAMIDGLRSEGHRPWHKEGMEHLNWVLLDFVDVVVHIFQEETREFYGLERLWGDAPQEKIVESRDEN